MMAPFSVNDFELLLLAAFAAAAGSLLGGLERVDLEVFCLDLDLDMGGKVADAIDPFFGRCRVCAAYLTNCSAYDSVAALAVFNNWLAGTLWKNTTLL